MGRDVPALLAHGRVAPGAADAWGRKLFVGSVVYGAWVLATYLLEKRVGLFARFDPVGRAVYALVANVGLGTAIASFFLPAHEAADPRARWRNRPLLLVGTAVLGTVLVARAVPTTARDPLVFLNAFTQVLPTSIAEIVVCFLLVGGAVRRASAARLGRTASTLLAIVVADVVFAVYHVAHSAPFDTPRMMAFLAIPGLVVGLVLFGLRDRALAILVQNLFGMLGVTKAADPDVFRHPFVWAYAVALVSVAAAVVALRAADRRSETCASP